MKAIVTLLALVAATAAFSQTATKADYAADTKTLDSTVKALYEVISGAAGQERDWNRFRNLFAEGARLIPTYQRGKLPRTTNLNAENYVTKAGPALLKDGFFESEIGRKVERYGPIAQVFSTYESKLKVGEKPFERGINSIQLTFDGKRWWVQTVLWAGESTAGPIPKMFLKK